MKYLILKKTFVYYMGKENWIPLMMRGFKFFAISDKKKDENQSVIKVKSFDGSRMLPCKKVLTEKVKSTNFVARKLQILLIETTSIDWIEYAVLCM